MTDIVERLRDWAHRKGQQNYLDTQEAANEIERLREALRYCADVPDHRSVHQMIRNVEDVARKALGETDEWVCPIGNKDCKENCGNYGCGN